MPALLFLESMNAPSRTESARSAERTACEEVSAFPTVLWYIRLMATLM